MRVFVAGHNGMVGSAIVRQLKSQGVSPIVASRTELDLANPSAVNHFFKETRIDQVYLAAAKVGGILANSQYPADFIYQNLMIQANVIHAAWKNEVSQLLCLGSSCIYPRLANQPIKESSLLSGPLEETNEPYAIAKIAGIKLCESYNRQYGTDFRSVMPCNLYGPGDNFHPDNSHVIPALIRRFHQATIDNKPVVTVWGSGTPLREFLYVDDLAAGCTFVMQQSKSTWNKHVSEMCSHVNMGSGQEVTIRQLAEIVASTTGYSGDIVFDDTKPDGTPRKLMDNSKLDALGWRANTPLAEGLKHAYQAYLRH